jgi:ribonucleoside-diphosphate reductase alpha chain
VLSQFQGRSIFDLRTWYTADGRLKPGKGFAAEVRHLPRLAAAITKAEAKARELGLISTGGAMSEALARRERLPDRPEHVLINFTTADGFRYTAGLGYFEDGRIAEIFLNADKIGTAIETAARDSAVVASLALQHGVPPETIRRALTRNGDGSASGALGTLLDLLASGQTS